MLNPSFILLCISPQMNVVISEVQAEAGGPLEMAVSISWGDHGGLVWEGIPSSTYDCIRDADGCLTPSSMLTSVFRCLEASNNRRDGALKLFLVVALAIAARSSVGVAAGGG